jgi:hypothetical protein
MKKMTRKQLQPHLEALNLELYKSAVGFHCLKTKLIKDDTGRGITLNELGIELVPEKQEITQENLCKFYLMFKDSIEPWPIAKFYSNKSGDRELRRLIGFTRKGLYIDGDTESHWEKIEIIDVRWQCLTEDHEPCKLCKDVRKEN